MKQLRRSTRIRLAKENFTAHLPDETLVEIFKFLVHYHFLEDVTFKSNRKGTYWADYFLGRQPLNIRGVCRRWRHTTLSVTSLWATWSVEIRYLRYEAHAEALEYLERFVTRALKWSGQALLDFSLECTSSDGIYGQLDVDKEVNRLAEVVVARISREQARWRRARIILHRLGYQFRCPRLFLRMHDLASLEYLSLHCWVELEDNEPNASPDLLRRLRRVSVEQIEYLKATGGSLHSLKTLVACLLQHADNLEDFRLSIHNDNNNSADPLPAVLKSKLRLIHISSPLGCFGFPLQHLTCPSLVELKMFSILPVYLQRLEEFLKRSSAPVVSLSLYETIFPINDNFQEVTGTSVSAALVACLRLVPTLKVFTLDWQTLGRLTPFTTTLIRKGDGMFDLVPLLEELKLIGVWATLDGFTDLITHRWHHHQRTIRILGCATSNSEARFIPLLVFKSHEEQETNKTTDGWNGTPECAEEGLSVRIERHTVEDIDWAILDLTDGMRELLSFYVLQNRNVFVYIGR